MLENFVDLQPGDTVVQNGATSAVGQVRSHKAAELGMYDTKRHRELAKSLLFPASCIALRSKAVQMCVVSDV